MLNRTARYAVVAAIVLVVGGIAVWRDVLPGLGGEVRLGVVDKSLRPVVGSKAPDFVLHEAGTGRTMRLSDYRGKLVVLNFWATWCGPCRSEMPEFEKTYAARSNELVVLAVDFRESNDQVQFFRKEFGLTFPMLLDREGSVTAHYGAPGLPATFFIDREGILRAQYLGPIVGSPLVEGLRAAEQGTR